MLFSDSRVIKLGLVIFVSYSINSLLRGKMKKINLNSIGNRMILFVND